MTNKPIYRNLPVADDSIFFFEQFKHISEQYWDTVNGYKDCWGYQIQIGSKWKRGLSETELKEFENAVGFTFPWPLANLYKAMNGLDRPGIDFGGDVAENVPEFRSQFYSFPDDLDIIKDYIDWIYEAKSVGDINLLNSGFSRIFPVFSHRFILVDEPGNPILSMHGKDIIYWADNLSRLLIKDVFADVLEWADYNKLSQLKLDVNFWLD